MSGSRQDGIDFLKGFGIFFVVTNHCFSRGSRKFLGTPVTEDIALYALNRAIHFAVPMFLFVSCVLLAKSLAKNFDLQRYSYSRLRKSVVPYVAASLCYFVLTNWTQREKIQVLPEIARQVFVGKAYFHLYFTVVLIQVSILMPALVKLLRTLKYSWRLIAIVAVVLQIIAFSLQRHWLHLDRPGSVFIWYLVPILLGAALGCQMFTVEDLKKDLVPLQVITATALLTYVLSSIAPLLGWSTPSDLINGSYAIFTAGFALWLWVVVPDKPQGAFRTVFSSLGAISLPVFLVHPAIMHILGGPRISPLLGSGATSLLIYWAITLVASYAAAKLGLRVSWIRWILGESRRLESSGLKSDVPQAP